MENKLGASEYFCVTAESRVVWNY